MIRRATVDDAPFINRLAGGDFTEFLANDMNICLLSGNGGAIFVWRGPGIFEVHVFFEQRGREVLTLSHTMLDILRSQYGARIFWAAVPIDERHVIMFTRLMGWKSEGVVMFSHGACEVFISENAPCLLP